MKRLVIRLYYNIVRTSVRRFKIATTPKITLEIEFELKAMVYSY